MSTFSAKCPHCSSLCDIPSIYVAKEISCPTCKKTYIAEPYVDVQEPSKPQQVLNTNYSKGNQTLENFTPAVDTSTEEETSADPLWRYSIKISQEQPKIIYFLRLAVWLALLSFINLNYTLYFSDAGALSANEKFSLQWDAVLTFGLIYGSLQLVQFLHVIAWNTQEAREER